MNQVNKILLLNIFIFISQILSATASWSLVIEQPDKKPIRVYSFEFDKLKQQKISKSIENFQVDFETSFKNDYWYYRATVKTINGTENCYLSLVRDYKQGDVPYNFDGKVTQSGIYRQSPHEPGDYSFIPKLLMQPVPMIAVKTGNRLEIAVSDNPAMYENYSTQRYDLKKRQLCLSSGDDGLIFKNKAFVKNPDTVGRREKKLFRVEPYYTEISAKRNHKLEGIFFRTNAESIAKIREITNRYISLHWSKGEMTDKLGASFFSTAYMNLRVNETKSSRYWVIPAIEYANKQYSRDGFWISMILPPAFSQSCFEHELAFNQHFIGAEKQLFTIIWAYRNYLNGFAVDTLKLAKLFRIVESRVYNGFYSGFDEKARVIGSWQGWADLAAFNSQDAISSNQGLLVTALYCAQRMGLKLGVSAELALKNYRNMFNPEIGGYAMSYQKDTILAVDALNGDLLSRLYLGKSLLPDKQVIAHYQTMKRVAKTKFGYKVFCKPDGNFLDESQYHAGEYRSLLETYSDGDYQRGGSWYLYDMLMLMDAHLAGAKDAEDEMIWRTRLEFETGNTTHEYLNTVTGVPYKPNMGWNSAVYVLWREVIKKGKATSRFFEAVENFNN